MKKLTTIILLFAMVLSMLVPVGAAEGAKLVMSGNNVANAQSVAAGVIGAVGAGIDATKQEYPFKSALDASADKWTGSKDIEWEQDASGAYLIQSAAEMYGLQQQINGGNTYEGVSFKLTVDLDLTNGGAKKWAATSNAKNFKGNFDGQGHAIKFAMVEGSGGRSLFGSLAGNSTVKNLTIIDSSVEITNPIKSKAGFLAGFISTSAGTTVTVSNVCVVGGQLTGGHALGLVGQATGSGNVVFENCKVSGVTMDAAAGNFENTKNATGSYVGGLLGDVRSATNLTISNCEVVNSTLTGDSIYISGLVGQIASVANLTITDTKVDNCAISSPADGNAYTGGLVSYVNCSNEVAVSNTYVNATVTNIYTHPETGGKSDEAFGSLGLTHITNAKSVKFDNCSVIGTVTAASRCAGLIGYTQTVTDVTIIGCKVNATLNASLGLAAGCIANTVGLKGKVDISNCSVEGAINSANATSSEYATAGLVSRVYTGSNVEIFISDCKIEMDVASGKAPAAGAIGWLRDEGCTYGDITVRNCSYSGVMESSSRVGGMIAHVKDTIDGALTISNCNVSGYLEGTAEGSGGVLGEVDGVVAKGLVVKNCAVDANVTGSSNSGGVVGYIKGTAKGTHISILNCSYSGTFEGSSLSNGGIAGNIDTNTSEVVVKYCLVDGVVKSNRSSGGFIGYVTAKNFVCEDIQVTGTVDITAGQNHNNRIGGMIGILNATTATLKDVVFSGSFYATLAPVVPSTRNPLCYAGGLIGYISNAASVVRLDNCHVNGALHFEEANDKAFVNTKGLAIFIGGAENSTSARPNVIYGQNVNYNLKALANATGHDVTLVGEGVPSMGNTAVLGYQIKWNKDETYDLRYIMGMKDVYDSIGVQAEIRYNFGEGVNVRYENVKVENVYKEVVDGESNTYRAADFAMDYLYTLTITNIPKEYAVHAGDLQVALIPYGISDGTTEFGVTTVQGDMGGFVELEDSDFGKEKPEAIDNALIHIYAGDYNVEETVKPATATATEVSGGKNVRHWYTNANTVLLYNFTVEEEGWYDAYFYLRLKNESVRSNQIVISNGETTETFTLFYVATSTHTGLKDSTNGTYLSEAFEIYLTPGDYTLTILPGWTGGASSGSLHYRDIYFVK